MFRATFASVLVLCVFERAKREREMVTRYGQLSSAHTRLQHSRESSYLQQKPRAFRHEFQCHQGGDAGQRADKNKDSPAVEVVLGSHTEPPAWKQQQPTGEDTKWGA